MKSFIPYTLSFVPFTLPYLVVPCVCHLHRGAAREVVPRVVRRVRTAANLPAAQPAAVRLAQRTGHVVAPSVLFDGRLAVGREYSRVKSQILSALFKFLDH